MNDEVAAGSGLSRRDALKKAALVGGAIWATPVVQSVNMSRAFAQTGSPRTVCYDVVFEEDGTCEEGRFFCLQPAGLAGGCGTGISVLTNGPGGTWTLQLPDGCFFVAGFSKCGRQVPCAEATEQDGVVTFHRCTRPDGRKADISHIELSYCCE